MSLIGRLATIGVGVAMAQTGWIRFRPNQNRRSWLADALCFPGVDDKFVFHSELSQGAAEVHRLAERHIGVVLPCRISTGVLVFEAQEPGLSWSCRWCGETTRRS
jgi:hypothetical protein